MFKIPRRAERGIFLLFLLFFACSYSQAEQKFGEVVLDSSRYISIDEIRAGMEAYCLTAYEGSKVEKFGLEVLSVVRNIMPGRDAILVKGTDERFIHTGPVAGCSGSPVYIDGRLAGALAFGWSYSKDPLYGVTPIEEMLRVSDVDSRGQRAEPMGFVFDYSVPVNFSDICVQIKSGRHFFAGGGSPKGRLQNGTFGTASPLPSPLVSSLLPAEVCEQMSQLVEPLGLMLVSGVGGGDSSVSNKEEVKLVPGSCVAVPLVTGDISMEIIGTVTEVDGDKVYSFGHGLLGYGAIDLPMATGRVHTVVSNVVRSFKFGSSIEIVGAFTADESTATLGRIGRKSRMIPLTIKIDRYNDIKKRLYECRIVNNRFYTPIMLHMSVASAVFMLGGFPPDHKIEYEAAISIKGAEPIVFKNVSTGMGIEEVVTESIGSIALLMNNPYKKVDIESIEYDIRMTPKNIVSHIWSVDLSDTKVKAGEQIDVSVVVESVPGVKKQYPFSLRIPEELASGEYKLAVLGGYEYRDFLTKTMPYRFVPQNFETLIDVMNSILAIKRDRLYCVLLLPASGISVERAELPDLPATKALVFDSSKRALGAQPYQRWVEKSLEIGTIVVDKKTMQVTVEE